MFAYVGSRTTRERNARGEGISVFLVDDCTGRLQLVQVLGDLINPSFLASNRAGDRLYCVHGDSSHVSSFVVDRSSGRISPQSSQSCGGKNPVHLALSPDERHLIVSNHISSSLAVLPLAQDGSLQAVSQLVPLEGTPGPHRVEQPFAKPHFNGFDPSGQFVIVPDKGLDTIFIYRFTQGQLTLVSKTATREGAGPRHTAFHANGAWCYCINELDSTVAAYRFDASAGQLFAFQVLSTLSEYFTGNSRAAEIMLSPNGRSLYASNRGEDSIAVFDIHPSTGQLRYKQTVSSGGKTPRFITLDPTGGWLYVLNEDSDSIVQYALSQDGSVLLASPDTLTPCASAVCIVFSS